MPVININRKEMSYIDKGKGFPIILGHSFLWNKEMWNPTIEELSKKYRCIAPDLWGHGQSQKIEDSIYSIEKITEDLVAFVDNLGIKKIVIIGLSVGGMWGTDLAIKYPDYLMGLVLMNTYVGSEPESTKNKYFQMIELIEKNGEINQDLMEQIIPLFFSKSTLISNPKLINKMKEQLSSYKNQQLKTILAIGRGIFSRKSLLNNLSSISIPTLIITGEQDLSRVPAESIEMAKFLKNVQLEIINDVGHISNLEKPDTINNLLINYLDRLKLDNL